MTCFLLKKVLALLYNPLIISIFTSVKKRQAMDEKDILLKTIEGLNASIASLSATNKKQAEQNEKLQARGVNRRSSTRLIPICRISLRMNLPTCGVRQRKSATRQ